MTSFKDHKKLSWALVIFERKDKAQNKVSIYA